MISFNVRQRLILITTLSIFISSMATFLLNQHIFRSLLYHKFEEKINFIGRHLASSVAIGIILNNKSMLKNITKSILASKDVLGVSIKDSKGNVLYQEGIINKDYFLEFPVTLSSSDVDMLYAQDKRILGYIVISYTIKNLNRLVQKLFVHSLFLAVVISCVIGVIVYFSVVVSFVKPFKELLRSISRVANGDLDFSVPVKGMLELRELAQNFSTMVASLKKHMRLLKDVHAEMLYQKSLAEIGKVAFVVAHEVKNPLGIIKGGLDIIKKKEVDEKTKQDMIAYIEDEINRLDKFIKEFLYVSRPKQPELRRINLANFLDKIRQKIAIEYPKKNLECQVDNNLELHTDASLLERILINLIKNAFEADADKVEIVVRPHKEKVKIEVKDNGKGISQAEKEKVFDAFYTTKEKGTGLGLVFVAQAVYVLKGKIEVRDNLPTGSIFVIYLPLNVIER